MEDTWGSLPRHSDFETVSTTLLQPTDPPQAHLNQELEKWTSPGSVGHRWLTESPAVRIQQR